MRVFMSLPQVIRIGSRSSKSTYELTLQSPESADLYTEGDKLQKLIAALPAVNDVTSDLQMRNPRVRIEIDRDKAASMGVNAQDIQSALYQGFGPSWVSTIYAATAQYKLYADGKFFDYAADAAESHPLDVSSLSPDAAAARKKLQEAIAKFKDARPARLDRQTAPETTLDHE